MIGRTLGHFRVDGALGQGGMGVVYRATDLALGREVALKVLPDGVTGGGPDADERRLRFFREARAAAAVTHPSIATVYEVGEADGHVFIAMELVVGQTLRERLAAGLEHADSFAIAMQIASGLARAHEAGIVHRDLKPENVMVTARGEAKILDFGLAKVKPVAGVGAIDPAGDTGAQLTGMGQIMGTPPYMSPEQALGHAGIDARTDVFSFGVMLHELLTGNRPFRGTTVEVLYAVIHNEPEPVESVRPDVAPALAAVVARCLRKQPADRFASGGELLAALHGVASAFRPSAGHVPVMVSGVGTAFGSTQPPTAPAPRTAVPQKTMPMAAQAAATTSPALAGGHRRVGIAVAAVVALVAVVGASGAWIGTRGAQPTAPPLAASVAPPPSPRETYLAAAETLKDGSYKEPKTVAECQVAYDTYKRLLPVVKPSGWDSDPVKFVPGNVRTFAPGCFGRAGDCATAWAVYKESWRLDPLLAPASRALDDQAMRAGFEAVTQSCAGK